MICSMVDFQKLGSKLLSEAGLGVPVLLCGDLSATLKFPRMANLMHQAAPGINAAKTLWNETSGCSATLCHSSAEQE